MCCQNVCIIDVCVNSTPVNSLVAGNIRTSNLYLNKKYVHRSRFKWYVLHVRELRYLTYFVLYIQISVSPTFQTYSEILVMQSS